MTLLHAISRSHGNDILQIFSLGPDQEKSNAIWMLSTATCYMLQLHLYMLRLTKKRNEVIIMHNKSFFYVVFDILLYDTFDV